LYLSLTGPADQSSAARFAELPAERILVRRRDVKQSGRILRSEQVGSYAVIVHRNRDDPCTQALECPGSPRITGLFQRGVIARPQNRLSDTFERLAGTGSDHDLLRLDSQRPGSPQIQRNLSAQSNLAGRIAVT
jgi:hypothetical protein